MVHVCLPRSNKEQDKNSKLKLKQTLFNHKAGLSKQHTALIAEIAFSFLVYFSYV